MEPESWMFPGVDVERANVARVYDALLGGTHNFSADRDVARAAIAVLPATAELARSNRAFLRRAVRFLAEAGVRQFIDIGSGVPTEGNVHEIARDVAPDARVIYADIDPVAVAHSRSILDGDDRATVVEADLRDPEAILGHPEVRRVIDFAEPVGLLLVSVLHFLGDEERPGDLVKRLAEALAPGSYLTISHATYDGAPPAQVAAMRKLFTRAAEAPHHRDRAAIRAFFDGFEFVEPGLVFLPQWRPDGIEPFFGQPNESWGYVGVGRKPGPCPSPTSPNAP